MQVLFPRSRNNLKAVDTDPGRHRPEPQESDELLPDEELESYLAALAPAGGIEAAGPGPRPGPPQVHQLRLPTEANEQLHRLANYHQTSPMALAQDWILQRLEWEIQQLQRR